MLHFYKLNIKYSEYLRSFDKRVPDVKQTNKKENRPFIGILISVNGLYYCAPLSSPKPKHLKMKNSQDFLKINNGIWGAINFNNMMPVTMDVINKIDIKILPSDTQYIKNYKNLLQNQLSWCTNNEKKIFKISHKLYQLVIDGKASPTLLNRCCDFKLLEEKAAEYNIANKKNIATSNKKTISKETFLDNLLDRARAKADAFNKGLPNEPTKKKSKDNNIDLD